MISIDGSREVRTWKRRLQSSESFIALECAKDEVAFESEATVMTEASDKKHRKQVTRGVLEPEGSAFLRLVWDQEDMCEDETERRMPSLGKKAPDCLECLGTVLSLLDRLASCWWSCQGGDHVIEYIAARATASSRATLRLFRFGFYDEALMLTRSVGEVANLVFLFHQDRSKLERWRRASRSTRLAEFSPAKVRRAIEANGAAIPIGPERYRRLSDGISHTTPDTRPQDYNGFGMPFVGAVFQEAGAILVLNELALATAFAAAFLASLAALPTAPQRRIVSAAKQLAKSVGAVDITTLPGYWADLRRAPGFQEFSSRMKTAHK